uniref:DUF4005 domain-containing protein n=1 Tax=Salix viminalis TaxID=40686 RepID=A0A6N2LVY4_SALVM
MGRASRWMINFLLGKKEEKTKKREISSYAAEKETTPTAISTYKRRWSFGKSEKKERTQAADRIRKAVEDAAAGQESFVWFKGIIHLTGIGGPENVAGESQLAMQGESLRHREAADAIDSKNRSKNINSTRSFPSRHKTVPQLARPFPKQPGEELPSLTNGQTIYITDTESSKAEVRSHSELKQRPKESNRAKNKQTTWMDGLNGHQDAQSQCSFSHSKHLVHENQDPWFIKLYRPAKSKDSYYDANITTSTPYSNYSKVLVTYEVS